MTKILVVDDDPAFNKMLSTFLQRNDFDVSSVHSSKSALDQIGNHNYHLILTDYKLPDLNGLELIDAIKIKSPETPIILMTNYSDIRTAVKSIQKGAFEFLTKPVNPDELLILVHNALEVNSYKKEGNAEKSETKNESKHSNIKYIIGKSSAAQKLWEHIELVAPTKMSVLILGESGTGKEYAAQMVHDKSARSQKNFYAVDCGALSKELAASELFGHVKGAFTGALYDKKGAFELAKGGTLFLDEIGNLNYEVQVQLLRALQESKIRPLGSAAEINIDVRVIAATNESLSGSSDHSNFRLDLYHRLNEFTLHIEPLRNRKADLNDFIDHFLTLAANELDKVKPEITQKVMEALSNYHWPGNLRELRNIIRRAVLLSNGGEITSDHIPKEIFTVDTEDSDILPERMSLAQTDLKAVQQAQEKEMILKVLEQTKYNKSRTAAILNIDRKTLYNKLKLYNIDA